MWIFDIIELIVMVFASEKPLLTLLIILAIFLIVVLVWWIQNG